MCTHIVGSRCALGAFKNLDFKDTNRAFHYTNTSGLACPGQDNTFVPKLLLWLMPKIILTWEQVLHDLLWPAGLGRLILGTSWSGSLQCRIKLFLNRGPWGTNKQQNKQKNSGQSEKYELRSSYFSKGEQTLI